MVERALQIAGACVEDMLEYTRFLRNDCQVKTQPKDILENIFYFRICSYTEQSAVINYLDKFVSEHKDVGISITWICCSWTYQKSFYLWIVVIWFLSHFLFYMRLRLLLIFLLKLWLRSIHGWCICIV